MSTIKSSNEHLTLNADGSSKDIKFQANGVEKASISSAGAFTSTTIDATALTGNLPAISGASLTGLTSAQMPTGSVLQVVNMLTETEFSTTATTMQDTPLTLSITPTSASSKILIIVNALGCTAPDTTAGITFTLQRATTSIIGDITNHLFGESAGMNTSMTIIKYDTPNTTSSVTYTLQARNRVATTIKINSHATEPSTVTLMEIAG